ncbi:MAG TPA: diaminopimelate dehydrogenase [Clostridiales bacterium]|jgi:diaminopimelate dehydrogenase|nr:diaminopimelate dehydrogenase [Clostridiales bacterium]
MTLAKKIRIAIAGWGNLGKGACQAIWQSPDTHLICVFSRRDPASLQLPDHVVGKHIDEAKNMTNDVDVLLVCGGSATDLPNQTPAFTRLFNTVDSFDTHAKIPEYFEVVNRAAKETGHLSAISVGWDPGLFSLNRLYAKSILPVGNTYTFWGKGVSQGHSDAIRRVSGVKKAIQYTVPVEDAMHRVRSGEHPLLSTRDKHIRVCYVVPRKGADLDAITRTIQTMPAYFSDYHTQVHFITEEEFDANHTAMPHGGFVIHSGKTFSGSKHIIEYSLKLDSNPEFTSSVLVAAARAVYRMKQEGKTGAITLFDIPPAYLSPLSGNELRRQFL